MKKIARNMILCALMTMSLSAVCLAEDTTATTTAAEPQATATVTATTQAAPDQNVVDWLDPAAGEWYSTKGNLVMTIEGNTINGCAVTDPKDCTYDYPRTGTFTIHEQTGDRTIKMDLMGHKSHQYLIVDNKMPLRRSLNADRYESIGGVYLGMTEADLTAAYGQPSSTAEDQGTDRWIYDSHHMDAYLQGGIVIGIRIYDGSDLKFDKSGLTAGDTTGAYAKHRKRRQKPTPFPRPINCRKGNTCASARISSSFPSKPVSGTAHRNGASHASCFHATAPFSLHYPLK